MQESRPHVICLNCTN